MSSRRPNSGFNAEGGTSLSHAGGSTPVGMQRNNARASSSRSSGMVDNMIDYGDAADMEGEEFISKRGRSVFSGRWVTVGLVAVFLVSFLVGVIVLFTTNDDDDSSDSGRSKRSFPNTALPGYEPKRSFDQARFDELADAISNRGITAKEVLDDPNSPQAKALRWASHLDDAQLAVHDEYMANRYVIAVMYFSFHDIDETSGSTDVAPWAIEDNWMTQVGYCDWFGIECYAPQELTHNEVDNVDVDEEGGTVRAPFKFDANDEINIIKLPSNKLRGVIPNEIELFTGIQEFDISDNLVGGVLPSALPAKWPIIRIFKVSRNNLDGLFPQGYSTMQRLHELDVSHNKLVSRLPEDIVALESLRILNLGYNDFTGTIPDLGGLKHLSVLNLHRNHFSGEVPSFLSKLTDLVDLRLGFNVLKGSLPLALGELTKLEILLLDRAGLSGPIPGTIFTQTTRLTELSLHVNDFTGIIPTEIEYLSSLTSLRLDHNELEGAFPTLLTTLTKLKSLYLGTNKLTGSFPVSMPSLVDLKHLHVNNNAMTGAIPSGLGRLYKLQTAHLQNNQFEGAIPSALGKLSSLSSLQLHENVELTGTMPAEVCRLVNQEQILQHLTVNCKSTGGGDVECLCCSKCY